MKALTIILTFFFSINMAQAASYECEFESSNPKDSINIKLSGKLAKVKLNHNNKTNSYKNCRVEKDDVGVLIDCNSDVIDFMILLNNEVRPASGGVMSSTHELYADIDC